MNITNISIIKYVPVSTCILRSVALTKNSTRGMRTWRSRESLGLIKKNSEAFNLGPRRSTINDVRHHRRNVHLQASPIANGIGRRYSDICSGTSVDGKHGPTNCNSSWSTNEGHCGSCGEHASDDHARIAHVQSFRSVVVDRSKVPLPLDLRIGQDRELRVRRELDVLNQCRSLK